MADLVTKIVDCVRVRDQTVIACCRLSHELVLGPSSPPSQGQQVVAPPREQFIHSAQENLLPKVLPVRHLRGSSS
jgi:hypothetical protein